MGKQLDCYGVTHGIGKTDQKDLPPPHPYWCDHCGEKAAFTIPGCDIEHKPGCRRHGEDAMAVYEAAKHYCITTGKSIK